MVPNHVRYQAAPHPDLFSAFEGLTVHQRYKNVFLFYKVNRNNYAENINYLDWVSRKLSFASQKIRVHIL